VFKKMSSRGFMLKNYKFLASLCGTSSNPQKPDLNINIKK